MRDKIRSRWTLLPAMLICALICTAFLSRLWMVDIDFIGPCAHLGDRQRILDHLHESGIHRGMDPGSIDPRLLQAQLLAGAGDYSFIGVRRQGIRLLIEASPEIPAPEIYHIDHARDLVAARDGVIESIAVYSGTACVKIGDTVRRGQLLIRGEETTGKNSETGEDITIPVNARGEITARCWFEGEAIDETTLEIRRPSGNSSVSRKLKFLNLELKIKTFAGYACEEVQTRNIPLAGLFLPLELEETIHREIQTDIQGIDPDILKTHLIILARSDALRRMATQGMEYKIASEWTDAQQTGNTLRVRAVYEIYANIAVTRDALIEEVN